MNQIWLAALARLTARFWLTALPGLTASIQPKRLGGLAASALLLLSVACDESDPIERTPRLPVWPKGDLVDVAAAAPDHVLVLAASGEVYLSRDGGSTFQAAHVPPSAPLRKLSMGSPNIGWAVGSGVLLRTDDGGAHWRRLRGPRREAEMDLLSVAAIDEEHAVVIGAGGLRLRTEDGGVIWEDVSVRDGVAGEAPTEWTALACLPGGAGRCWIAGDQIYATADAGLTWQGVERGESVQLPNISFGFGQPDVSEEDVARIRLAYEGRPVGLNLRWEIDARVSESEIERIGEDGDPVALFELIEARGEELRLTLEELGIPQGQIERLGAPPWGYEEFLDDYPELLERYWESRTGRNPEARIRSLEPVALTGLCLELPGGGIAVGRDGRGFESKQGGAHWEPFGVPGAHDLLDVDQSGDRSVAVGRQGGIWIRDTLISEWRSVLPGGSEEFFDALRGIAFDPEGERGYIVGDAGRLFVTEDTGATWNTTKSSIDQDSRLRSSAQVEADPAPF
jgi:photosystem II stability/assembly factor-like uncharacterized protein